MTKNDDVGKVISAPPTSENTLEGWADIIMKPTNNPNETPLTVVARLREARRYLRLRQQTVADYMGMKRQSYAAIEKGSRGLYALEIVTLCNLYRITPNELLGFKEQQ